MPAQRIPARFTVARSPSHRSQPVCRRDLLAGHVRRRMSVEAMYRGRSNADFDEFAGFEALQRFQHRRNKGPQFLDAVRTGVDEHDADSRAT